MAKGPPKKPRSSKTAPSARRGKASFSGSKSVGGGSKAKPRGGEAAVGKPASRSRSEAGAGQAKRSARPSWSKKSDKRGAPTIVSKGPAERGKGGKRSAASGGQTSPVTRVRRRSSSTGAGPSEPMRIARAMARAGLCSRREAERWIEEGRVAVNGKTLNSPGVEVGPKDRIFVDGEPLPEAEPVRLWRYHKPKGLVTTNSDPEGRATVFDNLPEEMPRVMSVGRLDLNTEGLLLLTNDGGLARHLELPSTGWLRRYRVRAWGDVSQADLDKLKDGLFHEGVQYGPIEATLDSVQGQNAWMTVGLREGKNREIRKIMDALGLKVNRLIRVSYGPFQLLDLKPGEAESVRRKVLGDQLGPKLAKEFGLDKSLEDLEDTGERPPPRGRPPKRRRN